MKRLLCCLLLFTSFHYIFCGDDETGSLENKQKVIETANRTTADEKGSIENVGISTEIIFQEIWNKEEEEEENERKITYTEAFFVEEDGTVYILETYKKCLYEYKQEKLRTIPLDAAVLPADLVVFEDKIYIFDDILSELQIYTKQGELLLRSKINLQEDYMKQLKKEESAVAILTYRGKKIYVNEKSGVHSVLLESKQNVAPCGYDFAEFLTEGADGTIYSVHTELLEGSILAGELVLRAVSEEGKFVGSYVLPTKEFKYLPATYFQVQEDGDMFLMVPGEESLEIRQIELSLEEESNLEEIATEVSELEQEYQEDIVKRRNLGHTCTKKVTLSREEIWKRLQRMAEYKWTLKRTNIVTYKMSGIALPREIEAIWQSKKKEKNWSVTMTGLPYCWGGFFSPYGGKDGITFEQALKNGYFPGNIRTEEYYKYATAGVDCSGLLTAAFGISQKLGTKDLMELGSALDTLDQLQYVDYLVSPGNHVIVFYDWLNETTMLVCESVVRDGKVLIHPKSLNELVVNGTYVLRSPW